jgi:Zn-dependent protease
VLFDLTFQQVLLRVAAYVAIAAVHGLALAGLARLLGDRGPQFDGRLTANPAPHLDLFGLLGAIFYLLGWIRPIAIDPKGLRMGRRGLVLCVVGSLLVTISVAALLLTLRTVAISTLPSSVAFNVVLFLNTLMQMSVWFAVFNVLPIHPLTGAHFLVAIRPEWREALPRFYPYAVGVLAVLMVTNILPRLLEPAAAFLVSRGVG